MSAGHVHVGYKMGRLKRGREREEGRGRGRGRERKGEREEGRESEPAARQ